MRRRSIVLFALILCMALGLSVMFAGCRPGYKEVWTPVESYSEMAEQNVNKTTMVDDMDIIIDRIKAARIEEEHKRVEKLKEENDKLIAEGKEPKKDDLDASELIKHVTADGTYDNIDYNTEDQSYWHPIDHLTYTVQLQIAINDPTHDLYGNPEAKEKVKLAMINWVTVGYHCDWNGWYNDIGVGMRIPDILLFGVDGLTDEQTTKLFDNIEPTLLYAKPLRFPVKERKVNEGGGNLTDQVLSTMKVALLDIHRKNYVAQYGEYTGICKDYRTMYWLKTLLENEMRPFGPYKGPKYHRWDAEGPKEDYSFQQHDQLIYFGGYGEVMVNGMDKYLRFTKGTQFALNSDALNFYAKWILEGFQFACRNGYRDISASGRGISRRDSLKGIYNNVKDAAETLLSYGVSGGLTVENVNALEAVLANRFDSVANGGKDMGAGGHRYYYESDYGVMNNEKYMASVRHASKRTRVFEYLNGENPLAYYTGFGATFFYVDGDEYYNLLPSYNWNMIPGTTTRQGCMPRMNQDQSYGQYGYTDYVGGVSNGKVGNSAYRQSSATVFDLQGKKLYTTGVGARKSYFMFEDGVVCLGADITSHIGKDVVTTINQTRWDGDAVVSIDGKETTISDAVEQEAMFDYVYHDKIGYISQTNMKLSMQKDVAGDWKTINERGASVPVTNNMFTLSVDHGERPYAQGYAYTLLMDTTAEATKAYAANPTLKIVANTKNIQAVYDTKNDVLQAVFHVGGKLALPDGRMLKVNKGACVIVEKVGEGYVMTIASNNYKSYNVKIDVAGAKQQVTIGKKPITINI